ncbi:hypothetical protein EJ03DRAFT_373046 [Teratosphaeria nubilosa]|uniref:Uncharacterized protein n=1 Tax=Teratosphaeria nubilosa TaxID=161662 RepID=A0A6G1LEN6_9PEZI|nr:hypothetical protein EJ03DRAFT_373046 [Teratosphaeria nubilosa]
MVDEVALMLMNLGTERRELLSAQDTDKRGQPIHRDSRTEAAIEAEREERQARLRQAENSADERTRALGAWNNPASFARDPFAENQPDWHGGQGHRLPQGHARTCDSNTEELENLFGEERRLYLQERPPNYSTAAGPAAGGYSPSSRTPRFISGGPPANRGLGGRGRVPPARPNTTRAPSPRRAGTVRFVAGQRVEAARPAARVVRNQVAIVSAAAASAAGTTPVRAASSSAKSAGAIARPRTAPAPSHPVAASSLTASSPSALTQQDISNASTPSSRSAFTTGSRAPSPSAPGTTEPDPTPGVIAVTVLAEYYAANPGRESDWYHAIFPDRVQCLRAARNQFITEACKYARKPSSAEASDYLEQHEDRKWIFEGVCRAKEMVENKTPAEVDEYYAKHPDEKDFCTAVRYYNSQGFYGHSQAVASRSVAPASDSVPPMQSPKASGGPASQQGAAAAATTTPPHLRYASATATQARPSAELPAKPKGALIATISAVGKELVKKRFELDAAVDVMVNLNILDRFTSLHDLIAQMESLAKAMRGTGSNVAAAVASILTEATMSSPASRSVGAAATRMPQPPRPEYVVHQSPDGLYDSD